MAQQKSGEGTGISNGTDKPENFLPQTTVYVMHRRHVPFFEVLKGLSSKIQGEFVGNEMAL